MAIRIVSADIDKVYVGGTAAQKVYLGNTLVWQDAVYVEHQVDLVTLGNGSWTVPAGVTEVTAHVLGGGGRGGSAQTALFGNAGGGGGAGGAYARRTFAVTPGQQISYFVGNGGASQSSGNGATGQTSWFLAN